VAVISSLYTALSGLKAQQRVLDVTAHNVANQTTAGYHRQRVELSAVALATGFNQTSEFSMRTAGVDAVTTSRAVNDVVALRAVREDSLRVSADTSAAALSDIEQMFGEPSDTGLSSQLGALWGAFGDLAQSPGDTSARTALLEQAGSVVNSLRSAASNLQATTDSATARLSAVTTEVNDLAARVATLNGSIAASPEAANDLLDQRDQLVAKLGQLVGATPFTNASGEPQVQVGGRTLVAGSQHYDIAAVGGSLQWASDARPLAVTSGEAASLTATINDVVPRYTAALNGVTSTLVQTVNSLHSTGYDQTGTAGRNFFDPAGVTAATISLSADVAGQPSHIAAGGAGATAPGALDAEMARQLAKLGDSTSGADAKFSSLVSSLAVETKSAKQTATIQGRVADSVAAEDAAQSSVSIDEEMTNLVAAQRAYEASARVLTAVDEMLGVLIERTGQVGR
jgi:flagellar hook-associated protein 1 FlgK